MTLFDIKKTYLQSNTALRNHTARVGGWIYNKITDNGSDI